MTITSEIETGNKPETIVSGPGARGILQRPFMITVGDNFHVDEATRSLALLRDRLSRSDQGREPRLASGHSAPLLGIFA